MTNAILLEDMVDTFEDIETTNNQIVDRYICRELTEAMAEAKRIVSNAWVKDPRGITKWD
jgi:hypothetical protein